MNRRTLFGRTAALSALGLSGIRMAKGSPSFLYHDARGQELLRDTFEQPTFWEGSDETVYPDSPYDRIRIQNDPNGIVTFISGTGNATFNPKTVAEVIFQHQDIIPTYMSRLKVGEYLGRGVDHYNGQAFSDMYFLADIKIFYMSVPLRTNMIDLGGNRFLCPIELVTKDMVEASLWRQYTQFMQQKETDLQGGWTIFPVVPMEYLVGYYLVEPDEAFGARVTMVTRMKFKEDVSWVADWGSELPIVLRQGMIAGFMGSVHACIHRMKE